MAKYRSRVDYAEIFGCDKEGYNLGLDASIFIRRQADRETFTLPRIGTQGSSLGAAAASTDISSGTDNQLDVAVDGGAVVTATLTLVGLNTGDAIAAELETAINNALIAGTQSSRVWVKYDNSDDHYEVYSQFTGTTTAVVITDAAADNVADDLKLGIANGGTEAVGTDDQDFLLYTTGGPTFEQPVEPNNHRTGRFYTGIVKKKQVASFDIDTMVNMSGDAGDSIDEALRVLLESAFGQQEIVASTAIIYRQSTPCFYFSIVRVSTIFGEYYTGGYCRDYTLTIPGDNAATQKFTGRAATMVEAGLAQIDGAVAAGTDVVLNAGSTRRYDPGAYVMVVGADGRTILEGADGSLTIASIDEGLNQLTLSSAVDAEDDGYIVPWHPGAIQQSGRDEIYTDLEGRFQFAQGGQDIDTTNIELALTNDHTDLDNRFGKKTNAGFIAGNRATFNLSVSFDLSNETYAELVQSKKFDGFNPRIEIGDNTSGRYLRIDMAKWIPSTPPKDLPENGPTGITMAGTLFQSDAGARDTISVEYR